MTDRERRGAVFVLPTTTIGERGPVAAWTSTAGWASAARRVLGDAWIATPTAFVDADEMRRIASDPLLSSARSRSWRRRVPTVIKTALKDVREWRRARGFSVAPSGPWDGHDVAFVWQRHELFHIAGLELAAALARPAVLFAPAPIVWQATQWGVRRPGWGSAVERLGEGRALVRADLVACGTDEVASQVRRLGVSTNRILVTPTGVDLDLFAMSPDERDDCRRRSREELRVSDRFVVGWVGSFRRFHALEQAVEATAFIGDATLLLIGDGPERRGIERLAAERGVDARFTGTVPYAELPAYLAAMDVALVLARPDQPFHYSPLKLGEYLAAGLPVIAPDALRKDDRVSDGDDVILVAPGDLEALTDALRQLSDHETAREKLRAAARATAERRWSWDHQIRRILEHLYGSHTFAP